MLLLVSPAERRLRIGAITYRFRILSKGVPIVWDEAVLEVELSESLRCSEAGTESKIRSRIEDMVKGYVYRSGIRWGK